MSHQLPSYLLAIEGRSATQIRVRVRPGARRCRVVGTLGNALKLEIAAPADQGRANQALLDFLAELMEVSVAELSIEVGHRSRDKSIRFAGGPDSAAVRALMRSVPTA
jgi:hypothetical protein